MFRFGSTFGLGNTSPTCLHLLLSSFFFSGCGFVSVSDQTANSDVRRGRGRSRGSGGYLLFARPPLRTPTHGEEEAASEPPHRREIRPPAAPSEQRGRFPLSTGLLPPHFPSLCALRIWVYHRSPGGHGCGVQTRRVHPINRKQEREAFSGLVSSALSSLCFASAGRPPLTHPPHIPPVRLAGQK